MGNLDYFSKILLVAESVLIAAVRALPGNIVAAHSPDILVHALLTDAEAAATAPAESKNLIAAMAQVFF